MTILSASAFRDAPELPTTVIGGPAVWSTDLFFSSDNDFLCVHLNDSVLRVVRADDKRELHVPNDEVRRAIWSSRLRGVVAVTAGSIRLYSPSLVACEWCEVVRELPEIGLEEWVDVACGQDTVCLATPRWARVYNLHSGAMRSCFDIRPDDGFAVQYTRVALRDGRAFVTVVSASELQLKKAVYDESGEAIASLTLTRADWALADGHFGDYLHATTAREVDRRTALAMDLFGETQAYQVALPTARVFEFASRHSNVIARVTPTQLTMSNGARASQTFPCEGHWYNAWPSDDGRIVVITYVTGQIGGENLVGVLELPSGRPIGQCKHHACGSPHVISFCNSFVASIVPDPLASTHPGSLGSGSIIMTDLRKGNGVATNFAK
jgi:hypothetical protein